MKPMNHYQLLFTLSLVLLPTISPAITADALQEKEQMLSEIGQECRAKVNEAKEQLEKKVDELKEDLASESKVLSEKIEERLLH